MKGLHNQSLLRYDRASKKQELEHLSTPIEKLKHKVIYKKYLNFGKILKELIYLQNYISTKG